jgi:DNA polymerase (family 10)
MLLLHAAETLKGQALSKVTIAGDFWRGRELISDVSLVATSTAGEKSIQERLGSVRVNIVAPERFSSALLYPTGNKKHLEQLEALSRSKDLILGPDGIGKAGSQPMGRSEAAIYRRLGSSYIPPELREAWVKSPAQRRTKGGLMSYGANFTDQNASNEKT